MKLHRPDLQQQLLRNPLSPTQGKDSHNPREIRLGQQPTSRFPIIKNNSFRLQKNQDIQLLEMRDIYAVKNKYATYKK